AAGSRRATAPGPGPHAADKWAAPPGDRRDRRSGALPRGARGAAGAVRWGCAPGSAARGGGPRAARAAVWLARAARVACAAAERRGRSGRLLSRMLAETPCVGEALAPLVGGELKLVAGRRLVRLGLAHAGCGLGGRVRLARIDRHGAAGAADRANQARGHDNE